MVAVGSKIGQQGIEPFIAAAQCRLRGNHPEQVVGGKTGRADARVDLFLQLRIGGDQGADMGAGQVEGLGRGDAGNEPIHDLGSGDRGRHVLRTLIDQVAMDLVGYQDEVAFATQIGDRPDLVGVPRRGRRDCAANKKARAPARRKVAGQPLEIHAVAALFLDHRHIVDDAVVGLDDEAEGMIGRREYDDLVARFGQRLENEADAGDDAWRGRKPVRVGSPAMPAFEPVALGDRARIRWYRNSRAFRVRPLAAASRSPRAAP